MPVFETTRKLGSGKIYETAANFIMSEIITPENNPVMSTREINTDNESKARIFTQSEVDE